MLGLEFDVTQNPYTLLFWEEKSRQSQGFREIWVADYPLDQLSKRRREARYGWINQDEQIKAIVGFFHSLNEIPRYLELNFHFTFGISPISAGICPMMFVVSASR
jgi:hypothetical protein